MLIRISLIVVIVAGLAAGVINFIKVKENIDIVKTERDSWHTKYDVTDAELNTTKGTLAKTEKELTSTKETLATSEQQRAAAVEEAEIQIKKSTELTEKLNATIGERDNAQAELAAYTATGYRPEQIAALGKQVKAAEEAYEVSVLEKKVIQGQLAKAIERIEVLTNPEHVVEMNASLRGKILVADPKWEFVVVNFGEEEGAKPDGELLVSRDGRLVAKVIIKDVQKSHSIANVMPGWKLPDVEVAEGDVVIPAHPKS